MFIACNASGAFDGDFAGNPDEPAHVVSALMIEAYLSEGALDHPIAFAEDYYVHYPKVAIGHWPPLFHLINAFWMLVFGATRGSMVALSAIFAAALPLSVFVALRRPCGRVPAFFCAAALATSSLVIRAAFTVSPDGLLGLLAFWTAVAYGRGLDGGRLGRLAPLGIALCAALTHGRAIGLLTLPLWGGLVDSQSAKRLWRAVLLLPALAIVWIAPPMIGHGKPTSIAEAAKDAVLFPVQVATVVGWPLSLLAACGIVAAILQHRRDRLPIAMVGLLVSMWSFHALIDVTFASPYAMTVVGGIAGLAAVGWHATAEWVPTRYARGSQVILALLGCGVIAANVLRAPSKPDLGYRRLVSDIVFTDTRNKISLVAADSLHEGAYVAEVALSDRRRDHVVLRASKVLAWSRWSGASYRKTFADPDAMAQYLDDAHVGLVIVQRDAKEPHTLDLLELLERSSDAWIEDRESVSATSPVRVFSRIGEMPVGTPHIRIDMRDKFGRYFELKARP